jgi:hypothetical protein
MLTRLIPEYAANVDTGEYPAVEPAASAVGTGFAIDTPADGSPVGAAPTGGRRLG